MKSYRVRPFSRIGSYPAGNICIGSDAIGEVDSAICSSTRNVLRKSFGKLRVEQPAFEMENWTIGEIRFFASIYLGNGPYASCRPYSLPIYKDVLAKSASDAITIGYKQLSEEDASGSSYQYLMDGNVRWDTGSVKTVDWDASKIARAEIIWNSIDTQNLPLLRGLYSLLKSEMLFMHFQFRMAAIAEAHISMDAAHHLVTEIIRQLGNPNPSSTDAGTYIEKVFGKPDLEIAFMRDYYKDRIVNSHPASRFGSYAIPPFSIDDLWFLQRNLRDIYFWLITKQIYEETDRENAPR